MENLRALVQVGKCNVDQWQYFFLVLYKPGKMELSLTSTTRKSFSESSSPGQGRRTGGNDSGHVAAAHSAAASLSEPRKFFGPKYYPGCNYGSPKTKAVLLDLNEDMNEDDMRAKLKTLVSSRFCRPHDLHSSLFGLYKRFKTEVELAEKEDESRFTKTDIVNRLIRFVEETWQGDFFSHVELPPHLIPGSQYEGMEFHGNDVKFE